MKLLVNFLGYHKPRNLGNALANRCMSNSSAEIGTAQLRETAQKSKKTVDEISDGLRPYGPILKVVGAVFALMGGIYQINEHLNKKVTELRGQMDVKFENVDKKFEKVNERIDKVNEKIEAMYDKSVINNDALYNKLVQLMILNKGSGARRFDDTNGS